MKKIIFDTDIGGDCDDAGALAIVHRAVKNGEAELLAVTVSTRDPWAVACADAINRYYGNAVPIGLCERAPMKDPTISDFLERYGKHIAENFENRYLPRTVECTMCATEIKYPEKAMRILRRLLAENRGEKITLVVTGSCLNLASLIESESDGVSPFSGLELIEKKVDKVVLMGGNFDVETAEYNIQTDIPSAKTVFEKCPVPIYVSHFDVGLRVMSGSLLLEKEPENPAAEAYRFHVGGKRHSWDPIAAFYAIYGTCGVFSDERRGSVTVDGHGVTRFEAGEGNCILIDCENVSAAETLLDKAMCGLI